MATRREILGHTVAVRVQASLLMAEAMRTDNKEAYAHARKGHDEAAAVAKLHRA